MKERIRQVMDELKLSQQDFANRLGISPASLSSIFTGRTNPTNNHVQAIHAAFPNINVSWLMFGEGSMYVHDASASKEVETPADVSQNETTVSHISASSTDQKESVSSEPLPPYASDLFGASASEGSSEAAPMPRPVSSRQSASANSRREQNTYRSGYNPYDGLTMKVDKQTRKIKEIRVFFDDGTYESFVPSK